MIIGFAAKLDRTINLATVSPTERATKVSALSLFGYRVTAAMGDEEIETAWKRLTAKESGLVLIKVSVSEHA